MTVSARRNALYRTIWRWHFYAGLFVVPMVLILSITGAVYLFKPEVQRWEERSWQGLPEAGAVSPDVQRDAALAAFPGARMHSYRLPEYPGDAVLIHLALPAADGAPGEGGKGGEGEKGGGTMRDVFVSPQGKVLGALDPQTRLMQIMHDIHGQLLIGPRGSWLVELAASWAIVMILTGLYLWWPQGQGMAGVIWPRLGRGSKALWRDLHAVTGFWVAGLAMVLLVTGLPWAGVWGTAFKTVRQEMGWVKGQQDWTIGGKAPDAGADEHAEHDHAAMVADPSKSMATDHMMQGHAMHAMSPVTLSEVVARAKGEHLAFPVLVTPPGAPQRFGRKKDSGWTVKSEAQNRPLRVSITFDATTGQEKSRETFADKHPIDRVVGYGVAWHEGQLFGLINQLIGVLTALMLVTLAVSGFVMWWARKPADVLGAPPPRRVPARIGGVTVIIVLLAAFLPMLAFSLLAIVLIERLILAPMPAARRWLGLPAM